TSCGADLQRNRLRSGVHGNQMKICRRKQTCTEWTARLMPPIVPEILLTRSVLTLNASQESGGAACSLRPLVTAAQIPRISLVFSWRTRSVLLGFQGKYAT